jgi:transposase
LWVLAKRLEEGRFSWPKGIAVKDGKLNLKHAALSMLIEGIDLKSGMQKVWYER